MEVSTYHLAQANISTLRFPLDNPLMAGFIAELQTINTLADNSPGFIWRLQDKNAGNATTIRPYNNECIIINLSVWESIEALSNYVYRSQHAVVMKSRHQWFEKSLQPTLVLWWIPQGHIPNVFEAKERLEYLVSNGVTPHAFSFKQQFPQPDTTICLWVSLRHASSVTGSTSLICWGGVTSPAATRD